MKRLLLVCVSLIMLLMSYTVNSFAEDSKLPTSVQYIDRDGDTWLERTYILSNNENPTLIPTEDFTLDNKTYLFCELLKSEPETIQKRYVEPFRVESQSKDLSVARTLLPETRAVETQDGYSGELQLDVESIAIEPVSYVTKNQKITATRTYPNLSDADVSLIPKNINENGRSLTLDDIQWGTVFTTSETRYTATASYTGTATSRHVSSYTVTANYSGSVAKTDTAIMYTSIFLVKDYSRLLYIAIITPLVLGATIYIVLRNRKRGQQDE